MLRHRNKFIISLFAILLPFIGNCNNVFAEDAEEAMMVAIQISPMNQKITLTPGERYYGTFKVTNPGTSQYSFSYETEINPFHVNEEYTPVYENNGDYNQIVNWITVINPEGVIAPNNTAIIQFYIDVPENAPAGGQYGTITVGSKSSGETVANTVALRANYNVAHLIYAEVAGETVRGGEVNDISVPSFLFSGNIAATARIKNTGNVHSDATHTLQIFPLFSNEEVFTNEEDPDTNLIMPGTERTTTLSWAETPSVGIFHVIYNVEYEGVESTVDKYVIVCPFWLLFLILLAIILIVMRFIFGNKRK